MPTLVWGSGGTTRSTNTSGAGDGWTTPNLAMPDARAIYDGTRPIRVVSVVANAGSGTRIYYYATGSSGWLTTGYHNIGTGTLFTFRVARSAGTIALGLATASGFTTYWFSSGDPVNWNPNGVQPGTMTWWQAPSAPTVNSITPSTTVPGQVAINISAPSDNGGASVTTYTHQFSLTSAFATILLEGQSAASTSTWSGLPTGTTIYHRVMAVNTVTAGVGKKGGAASTTKSFSLGAAPSAGPTIAVTPAASGQSAAVTLTPPSDTGGLPITGYNVTAQPLPSGTPIAFNFLGTSGTFTASGLTPGVSYRWTAVAYNAVGNSPVSAPVTALQPNPSTNPGDFFDGSTAPTNDQTYAWTGAAGNSTSIAVGHAPTGWATFAAGAAASGGTGVVARVTGAAPIPGVGTAGTFAARATFFSDATAPGFFTGIASAAVGRSDVIAGQTYTGSIFVTLSRTNRVAARIQWLDAAGNPTGAATIGPAQIVGTPWARLSVTGDAPALGVFATVTVVDVAGDGHTNWRSGDVITTDAAMLTLGPDLLPYFDGSFPDTDIYEYSWTGTANSSTSLRESFTPVVVDPLADPDCAVVPSPPRPPAINDDCIEQTGIWRRYWVVIPAAEVSDWLTMLPTLILQTGDFEVRQARIRYYPNPFEYSTDTADVSNWCSEQIISFIPTNTVLTIDGPLQRVFAEVNGGAAIAADHLLYGTGGVPATWPSLSCGISYLVSFDVPLDAPIENFNKPGVLLTRRT